MSIEEKLKKLDELRRTPFAGLTNGSSSESATAIPTPPMAIACEGRKSNWWAWDTGTVRIEINCPDAAPGTSDAARRSSE